MLIVELGMGFYLLLGYIEAYLAWTGVVFTFISIIQDFLNFFLFFTSVKYYILQILQILRPTVKWLNGLFDLLNFLIFLEHIYISFYWNHDVVLVLRSPGIMHRN